MEMANTSNQTKQMNKPPLLILTGPTSVGKTELSIALAKKINGEIISADSMQVYRGMDIGSAKIRPDEMQGVVHHMIDILDPTEEFNIAMFQQKAKQYISEIQQRGHIPILVGGTGFYIQSVLYDIQFEENEEKSDIRARLEQLYEQKGARYIHRLLAQIDPTSAAGIHENNQKRCQRAIEYFFLTGHPISKHNETQRAKDAAYRFCYFVLNDKRERLYSRIDQRVDLMIQDGLVEEVKKLKEAGCHRNMVSMKGLGYKEILDYLNGDLSLEEAIYIIKRDTRHFAKRQLTWFRREKEVIWINKPDFQYDNNQMISYMLDCMNKRALFSYEKL